jgi:hypothetical protein
MHSAMPWDDSTSGSTLRKSNASVDTLKSDARSSTRSSYLMPSSSTMTISSQPVVIASRPLVSPTWSTASSSVPSDLGITDRVSAEEEAGKSSYLMNQEIHFRAEGDVTAHARRG